MVMAKIAIETRAQATGRRVRWRRILLLAVAAAVLIGVGGKLWELRRYRRAMIEIKQEVRAGRHGHAAQKVAMLLAWQPDSDEALYLLGVCEKARGQLQAALSAWERVSPSSPFSARAIQGRTELLIERGRLADAETLIIQAMSDPRGDRSKLGPLLGLVYSLQGRVEERQRVIEACWDHLNEADEGGSEPAILLVRLHIQTPTIEEARSFLDQVARLAPDDDRGWLGKAQVAIHDVSYDEAARWLAACLRRRPDDIPVWRVRLDWALATRRLADVRQSLSHLPVKDSTSAQVQRLTAWLAAFRGDLDSERLALERLVKIDTADLAALDRLATIAEEEDKLDGAAEFRRMKAEIGRLQMRFEKLYKRNQTMRDAEEMASLAEQLSRPFEAKALRTIARAAEPERRDLIVPSIQHVPMTDPQTGTLADLLAEELAMADLATTH
jgi:enediyne biosynthesis protein E4